ncbi:glycosyl hydrolase family 61-domain-containing protein [Cladorrhinum sp. PSN259]|nr:glycosyl hydrolase family 61-domain-containing protein [Cladorrhinum sp. PSN259]
MHFPSILTLGLATTFASLSTAHTVLTTIWVDGKNQGDGTCIRMGLNPDRTTFPIPSIDSSDMACGLDGHTPVAFTCPAKAGSSLTFAFRSWADDPSRGPIDKSHVGSISIYLKHLSSPSASATGGGWFKIFHSGYSESKQKWSAATLIDNHGLLTVSIPSAIPSGPYLVRTEVLALQNYPETQFFVNCAQLYITGTPGSSIPDSKTVSIPGHVHYSDKGLNYNIYETDPSKTPYLIPGPKPYFPTSSSSSLSTSSSQTSGLIPKGCILKNANWCATELPNFNSENSCWTASDDCWRQVEECYAVAPPSGYHGCKLWSERKCDIVQKGCKDGAWEGPKNKGEKIATEGEVSQPVPGGKLPRVDKGEDRDTDDGEGKAVVVGPGVPVASETVTSSTTFKVVTTTATETKTSSATLTTTSSKGQLGGGVAGATSVKPVPVPTTGAVGGGCKGGRQRRRVVVVN